jgi:hypothetical protein
MCLKKEIPKMPELPFKIPGVWTEDNTPGLARNIPLVGVELKLGAIPAKQSQYYIPCKAQIWIQKCLDRLPSMDSFGLVSLSGTAPTACPKTRD